MPTLEFVPALLPPGVPLHAMLAFFADLFRLPLTPVVDALALERYRDAQGCVEEITVRAPEPCGICGMRLSATARLECSGCAT